MELLSIRAIAAIVAGMVFTIVLIAMLKAPAQRFDLVDVPGGRKNHARAIPLVGGLAMFVAFCIALLIVPTTLRPYASLVVGMGLMTATGLVDDAMDISAGAKLLMQVLAAVLMVSWGEVQIHTLGNLLGFGTIELGEWAIPFTVLCTLIMINAINMADGTDGLAGGISLIVLAWLFAVGWMNGATQAFLAVTGLLGATVIAFLFFNLRVPGRRHASVFMGDSGSLMLGFAIAWLAVYVSQNPNATIYPISIAWILILPVIDLVSLYIRRIMKGRSPFLADQEHLHHVLLRAGFSVTYTVLSIIVAVTIFGAVGLLGWHYGIPEHYLFLALLPVFILHYALAIRAWKLMRLLKSRRLSDESE